jgi:adenosylcobinamide-phosphate synthase
VTAACGSLAVLALAFAVDAALGDPPNRWHPVAWLGTLIAAARRRLARGSPARLLLSGALVAAGIAVIAAAAGCLVLRGAAAGGPAGRAREARAHDCSRSRAVSRCAGSGARPRASPRTSSAAISPRPGMP